MIFHSAKDLIRDVNKNYWLTNQKSDRTFITWLPVTIITFDYAPKRILGISDMGYWTVLCNTGDIRLIDTRDNCYHIIACLQKNRDAFENLLEENLVNKSLDTKLADTFPLTELLKMALQTSSHWSEQAVWWLEEKDMDNELDEILQVFIGNKNLSQKARHQAFKILKRWQKTTRADTYC